MEIRRNEQFIGMKRSRQFPIRLKITEPISAALHFPRLPPLLLLLDSISSALPSIGRDGFVWGKFELRCGKPFGLRREKMVSYCSPFFL